MAIVGSGPLDYAAHGMIGACVKHRLHLLLRSLFPLFPVRPVPWAGCGVAAKDERALPFASGRLGPRCARQDLFYDFARETILIGAAPTVAGDRQFWLKIAGLGQILEAEVDGAGHEPGHFRDGADGDGLRVHC